MQNAWTYESHYGNIFENMGIGKITSDAEYRIDEQSQNFLIVGILKVFQIDEILKFVNFTIWKISKMFNL